MPCNQECFIIVTKWESYTVDHPFRTYILSEFVEKCDPPSDEEAEARVAEAVKTHNEKGSVEGPNCPAGCTCVPYETPPPPQPLMRRISQERVNWYDHGCSYEVLFTVSVAETKIPVGVCRPG